MSRLFPIAALALVPLVIGGCGSVSQGSTPGERASKTERPKGHAVSGPDVFGLSEGDAAKLLASAGLVMNVRYVDDVPRRGAVFRAAPAAGSDVPEHSVVLLHISLPPRLPLPGPENELETRPLSKLVTAHPNVFVGLYRDQAGVPHVVFGPGVDAAQWAERLREAARGVNYPVQSAGYRTDTCSRSEASLRAVQNGITTNQDWTERENLAFGVWVHPETCTVRVESDLLRPAEIKALVERYGTAISFDTTEGSHPVLLMER
jgi:hypothetical protein